MRSGENPSVATRSSSRLYSANTGTPLPSSAAAPFSARQQNHTDSSDQHQKSTTRASESTTDSREEVAMLSTPRDYPTESNATNSKHSQEQPNSSTQPTKKNKQKKTSNQQQVARARERVKKKMGSLMSVHTKTTHWIRPISQRIPAGSTAPRPQTKAGELETQTEFPPPPKKKKIPRKNAAKPGPNAGRHRNNPTPSSTRAHPKPATKSLPPPPKPNPMREREHHTKQRRLEVRRPPAHGELGAASSHGRLPPRSRPHLTAAATALSPRRTTTTTTTTSSTATVSAA